MSRVDGVAFESDLTSFEYGVSEHLKGAEVKIMRHIASQIGCLEAEEINSLEFDRVASEREQVCRWKFRIRKADGGMETIKLQMPRVITESGDRITSSGNFLQNVLAWFSFLVDETGIETAFRNWLRNSGKEFSYKSARDKKIYVAVLALAFMVTPPKHARSCSRVPRPAGQLRRGR